MSALPTPLRDVLAPALSERAAQRLWREITAQRTARALRKAVWVGAFRGAALAAAIVLVAGLWLGRTGSDQLLLADGRDLAALEVVPAAADDIALADGSHVERERGTRLRVLQSTASVVNLLLEGGRARFHVQKGGSRRWIIECGLLSAEVVGTEFVIERDQVHARVGVIEGVVLVRGDRVPDHVKRLGAGQSVEVWIDTAAGAPAATSSLMASPPSIASSRVSIGRSQPAPDPASTTGPESWRDLAGSAEYARAYEALGEGGIVKTSVGASVDELLALADVARYSGHPREAIAPLAEITDKHAGDPRASLAAYTLGNVLLSGSPALAAQRFEQALAGGLPATLVEDAMAHVVEARARSEDRKGAQAAAARYEAAYPNGARRQAVKKWSGNP